MSKTKRADIAVVGHDNRGDDKIKFGFIYFSDGSRVAYTDDKGVFICNTTHGTITVHKIHIAQAYARKHNLTKID